MFNNILPGEGYQTKKCDAFADIFTLYQNYY